MRLIPRILLCLLLLGPTAARGEAEVEVELLTVGPGDDLYAAFGHSALLVLEDGVPHRVYNFGYANFDQPNMVLRFLRGRAKFYVAHQPWAQMMQDCRDENRTLSRQSLALSAAQHRAIVSQLREQVKPENRRYSYHHFWNNCATRPRDLIDQVLGGEVKRRLGKRPPRSTLRQLNRLGFTGRTMVQPLTDLVLGKPGERLLSVYEEGFVPGYLSESLQRCGLAGAPLDVYRRKGKTLHDQDPRLGLKILYAAALLALALALALAHLARRRPRPPHLSGLPLALLALLTGLPSLLVWGLVLVTDLPELRQNELIFALWPTDLLLFWPAMRWLSGRIWAGPALRLYALARVVVMGWILVGHLSGALIQQPLAPLVMAGALAVGLLIAVRNLPRKRPGA